MSHRSSSPRPVSFPSFLIRGAAALISASVATTALVRAGDANWAAYLGDSGATHYSSLNQITAENVSKLQPAWTYHSGGIDAQNRSQIQCNPLIIDGVLYGVSPTMTLFALDAAKGTPIWTFDAAALADEGGAGLTRGLVWWTEGKEKRLFLGAGRFLYAIDPDTGKPIPSFGTNGRIDLLADLDRDTTGLYFVATTPGVIYRDLIITPGRVGEGPGPAAPGHIRAFDVRTGKRRWIFHTIPFPGEKGYETWPTDAWKSVGGANCWPGLVIDQKRGVAFIPTGSAAFDFWGGDRIGQNLYSNCLLAIDVETGKLKWHFQFVHHDVWDRDPPAPPVLCQVKRGNKIIDAVAQTLKSGHVWVFDRETGESLFPWHETPIPKSAMADDVMWPTQPLPDAPKPFTRQIFSEEEATDLSPESHTAVISRLRMINPHRMFDPPSQHGTIIFPGFDGGAEWGGPAVDPNGVLYVNANEMPWILELIPATILTDNSPASAIYGKLCVSCHGPDRQGNAGQTVPRLVDVGTRLKENDIIELLRKGRSLMPSFNFLSPAQKQSLAHWLISPESEKNAGAHAPIGNAKAEKNPNDKPWTTTGYNRFFDPNGYPAIRPPWGTLSAIDLNTGNFLWQVPLGEFPELTAKGIPPTGAENYGGPVATAGGVIFIGASRDENFRAFDSKTGKELWKFALPAAGYATPATYSVNGRQYVVIACGGGKSNTKSGDAYMAFALPEK